ncbi:MAG: type IV secretion system DNA-binding domain-containing protein [Candidatus Liptonbacteria bacterium]|nr:type IV secretion system DNA-binding domain-containing protein [Candidatus Liptonbacteria bacterium]
MTLFWIIVSFLVAALVPLVLWYAWNIRRRLFFENFKLQLYLIRIPLAPKEGKDPKTEVNLSEQLFNALASLKRPFVFEAAVSHVGEDICFYIAVPRAHGGMAARQIQGLFPDAQVEEAEDYNLFNPHGEARGAFVSQKNHYALPIRTYQDIGGETFAPILSGLSKINTAGEGAAIQVIARPVSGEVKKTIAAALQRLKAGETLERVLSSGGGAALSSALKEAFPGARKKEGEPRVVDEPAVHALETKLAKPLFAVNVRVLASAPSQYQADAILDSVTSAFTQFSAPNRNELKTVAPRNLEKLIYQYSFREFDPSQAMTLTSEELASVFHLPTPFLEVPKIKWLKAKEAAPPTTLSAAGVPIGESVFRGERKTVRIADEDRRRHIYVVGQTGTGKSVLLANMLADDIERGKGAAIIDPHGDLVEAVMPLIPEERQDDVIVLDPGDLMRPVGLNMLDVDPARPEEKTFVVNELQGIFNKLFPPETMGPMFEQYMRNALLLLMEDTTEPATLMEVPRVFTDSAFRARKLARIANPAVVDFWEKEAVKAGGEASLQNITPYITSKFNNFIANDYLRPIISQPASAFRFREVMDEGKILLVNLSKGRIGDINANLLGMIIVGKLLMAALSRVDIADQEKRRDFNLYIDEFQNFTTDSISVILSEARKYRLNLVIAHQFIAQLTEKIRDSVFGNVGSMISFRVGVQDAEFLEKQFAPTFTKQDLINIDNFNAYAKLLMGGETRQPFNIRTLPPLRGSQDRLERIKELSRARYGRDRHEVEAEALKRIRE